VESAVETLEKCPGCGRDLSEEDYLCGSCGYCQHCCQCSTETAPESTLAGD